MAAMLDPEFIKILACPVCKTGLSYRTEPESLKCEQCGRIYPVREGIPVLIVEEASAEDA